MTFLAATLRSLPIFASAKLARRSAAHRQERHADRLGDYRPEVLELREVGREAVIGLGRNSLPLAKMARFCPGSVRRRSGPSPGSRSVKGVTYRRRLHSQTDK